jgi:lipid II:glycine glycyltransferase (peptidoglycan interpeptide bridge formation enzyme)
MKLLNKEEWFTTFSELNNPHILQSYEWGELKSLFGWTPYRFSHNGTIIQLLLRNLPLGYSIAYIPKSNIDPQDTVWSKIDQFCKSQKAIFLKFEPDEFVDTNESIKRLESFIESKSIQPQRTIEINLNGSEDSWLANMKSKTRYNIRLAIKKDIKVVHSDDIDVFYDLILDTSERDKFGVHSKSYYQNAYQLFSEKNNVALLLAYYQNIPLAGIMVYKMGNRSWYFYGASNNQERNRMPTYLLQFEAMKWAKSQGCVTYDLWGIPDAEEEKLEREFEGRSDGLWGVYRFKRGFGGAIKRSLPAFDRVYNPLLYKLVNVYQKIRGNLA